MSDIIDFMNLLTEEGQERFALNILKNASAEDILEGLYMEKKAKEAKEEIPAIDANGFSSITSQVQKSYNDTLVRNSMIAGSLYLISAELAKGRLGVVSRKLDPILQKLSPFLARMGSKPINSSELFKGLSSISDPKTVATAAAIITLQGEINNNNKIHGEHIKRLDELYNNRSAASVIDEIYKQAKMSVPSAEEIDREISNPRDNLEEIKCENCDYEGKTTELGLCPSCGVIGGIKPTLKLPKAEPSYFEPMNGISVTDADSMGRMGENII